MSDGPLKSLLNVFRGDKSKGDDDGTVLEELLVTVLARATYADSNIAPDEIETIQQVYQQAFGKSIEPSAIRTAARSDMFEETPLMSYVKAAGRKLSGKDKYLVCNSLRQVMAADERLAHNEIDFFNQVINALDMTPAEIAGLVD